MKISCGILFLVASVMSYGCSRNSEYWKELSIHSQNIGAEVLKLKQIDIAPDLVLDEPEIDEIEKILTQMVDDEVLVSYKICVKFEHLDTDHFKDIVELLSSKYGVFVALEMLDLGARRAVIDEPSGMIWINIRLPEDDMMHLANSKWGQIVGMKQSTSN